MDALKSLCALYVDDDEDLRNTVGSTLKLFFEKCHIALNGHEALRFFRTFTPDIVIIDIEMPILDGIDLATKIREVSSTVPIIVITGYDKKEYLQRLVTLGISSYLVKPITTQQLTSALTRASVQFIHNKNNEIMLPSGAIFNSHNATIRSKGEVEILTPFEKKLLEKFLSHKGTCLDQECLITHLWGDKKVDKSSLRQLIKTLRLKAGASSIKTVYTSGYMMV